MKQSAVVKQQQKLDAVQQRAPRKGGSSFLAVFFVGIIIATAVPVGYKFLNSQAGMKLAARKPMEKTKFTDAASVVPIKLGVKKDLKAEKEKTIGKEIVASAKIERPVEKPLSAPAKVKVREMAKVAKADIRSDLRSEYRSSPKARVVETMNELALAPSAEAVQLKAEEEFFNAAGAQAADETESFKTIYNATYDKDGLASCKQRCLLRIKDANGKSMAAIFSGPDFAAILTQHSGSINLTGKQRIVKNHSVFMVQNITFNLPANQAKEQTDPNAGKQSFSGSRKKNLQASEQNYEDLSTDLSR